LISKELIGSGQHRLDREIANALSERSRCTLYGLFLGTGDPHCEPTILKRGLHGESVRLFGTQKRVEVPRGWHSISNMPNMGKPVIWTLLLEVAVDGVVLLHPASPSERGRPKRSSATLNP
jgi:hypothetical protein